MGWSNCGEDSRGRPIGYAHIATCDHPGCGAKIDRGLSYACGGMHGEEGAACEGYYCSQHMVSGIELKTGEVTQLCVTCVASADATGLLADD